MKVYDIISKLDQSYYIKKYRAKVKLSTFSTNILDIKVDIRHQNIPILQEINLMRNSVNGTEKCHIPLNLINPKVFGNAKSIVKVSI